MVAFALGAWGNHGMASDWFKDGQNQLKARHGRKKQVFLGRFVLKSVTMSPWPTAELLVCVFVLDLSL